MGKWVYRSIKEWEDEFPFWSNSTIKRVVNSLKKHKVLLVKKIYPNIFYSIDEENISKLEVKMNGQNELLGVQNDPSNGQIDPTKGQIDPSPIYNENPRDYTEF